MMMDVVWLITNKVCKEIICVNFIEKVPWFKGYPGWVPRKAGKVIFTIWYIVEVYLV